MTTARAPEAAREREKGDIQNEHNIPIKNNNKEFQHKCNFILL